MADIDTTSLIIGNDIQFFFDDGIIESVHNLTRTVHSPVRSGAAPVLQSDQPWEHVTYFTANGSQVWRDESNGRFHCRYQIWKYEREKRPAGTSLVGWGHSRLRQCYAYSDDGVTWIKPPMGIQMEGDRDTNIVFGTEEYGSVYSMYGIENPFEPNPAQRYKAVYTYIAPGASGSVVKRAAYSADCVRWTPYEQVPTFGKLGGHLGDCFEGAFDPVSRNYIALTRHPYMGNAPRTHGPSADLVMGGPGFDISVGPANRRNRRRIFQIESSDFLHWSEPRVVLAPESDIDNLDDSFYAMTPMRLGSQWLGFLTIFHMVSNTFSIQLAHSRDGKNWRRIAAGRPWFDRGAVGSWEEFMVSISSPPVSVNDEEWIYYGASKNHHDWWVSTKEKGILQVPEIRSMEHVGYYLGLAKLRTDGYVSIGANQVREGLLQTQPFSSDGDRLIINAACGADGYIKVAATDQMGIEIPGYGFDDCNVFTGDSVRHEVTWRGNASFKLPEEKGTSRAPYRMLRVLMRNAELYSFRVCAHPSPA